MIVNKGDFERDVLPKSQVDDQGREIYQETKLYAKWNKKREGKILSKLEYRLVKM